MSEQEELTIEGPGFKGGYKGGQLLPLLLALMVILAVYFIVSNHEAKAADHAKSIEVATDKQTAAIEKLAEAVRLQAATAEKGQRTMAYILSLPQAKREQLGLAEPDEIRQLRRGRYDR